MKPFSITLFAAFAVTSPLFASITISSEFGQLRDSAGAVISNTTTLYAIIYDTNGDSSLPGGLLVNQSLTANSSVLAFGSFAGLTLAQGLSVGGDTVVKFGTFNDRDGYTNPGFSSSDFTASGITETSGRNYAVYWFPGVSTAAIPITSFQVGGINETVNYTGTGANFIGTVIPADGAAVTTSILDTDLGGNVADTSRFTAIATTPTFHWDTNMGTAGAQGGTGDWNTTSATNWTPGSSNYVWAATGTDNAAVFGGTAGTVTIATGGVTANDLTFNTTGYTITGSTLTLNGTTPTLTTGTGVSATIFSQILGSAGLTKAGSGNLVLNDTNTYTGNTTIQGGTLVVNGSTSALSAVIVESGGKLAGTGTVGGNTTVQLGGKYSAGAVGEVGQQTFSGNLDLQSGSIFEWDLTSASTSSGFDQVIGAAAKTFTAAGEFRVVSNLDFSSDNFWDSTKNWNSIFSSFGTNTGWASVVSATVYNSSGTVRNDVSAYGSFSINGTTLTWTAVPEVSNVLIGGLIGFGMLRRRRESAL